MSALLVRGLTAARAGVPVVRDLDLTVEPGEIVALLGPNGAGKTTVLETLGGVLPPLVGTVHVGDKRITGVRQAARLGVSYLREGRGLFTQLNVRDNLALRAKSMRKADQLLQHYPLLTPLASRRVGLLSGGEQQLLALACALAVQPKVLLIDEMSMGLAPIVVTELFERVKTAAQGGVGVLFVEQHVQAALDLADRGLVLQHGQLVMQGDSASLTSRLDELHDSYFDLAREKSQ